MNTGNPVQIDLFGVSATRTKDTSLAEHIEASLLSRRSSEVRARPGGLGYWNCPSACFPAACRSAGSACDAASGTSRSGTPASSAAVMNACRNVRGSAGLTRSAPAQHAQGQRSGATPPALA
jgi:hypothetical protein